MNKRMIFSSLGKLMLVEAGLMVFPVIVALVYGEKSLLPSFIIPIAVMAAAGVGLSLVKIRDKRFLSRDGYVIVALGWMVMSFFGALPFFISRQIPNFVDAVFESVSGFTTTGASILSDVEALGKSMLFWRSLTHWIGGMGVLVFMMAVLPLGQGNDNLRLMRAESTGPDVGKLVPKSKNTAQILYSLYIGLTLLEMIFLLLGGMTLFESLTLSFGTAGTGGFGIVNSSCGSYSPYVQWVITVFMTLFGINFAIYFMILCGKFKSALKNEELRSYLGIIVISAVIIIINIRSLFDSLGETIRAAFFQVSSVMTTTGFSTADFDKWPELSRVILIFIMCVGGCAGSTGGGFKVARVLILLKSARKEMRNLIRSRSVSVVTFEGKKLSRDVIRSTHVYFVLYVLIFMFSFLLISATGGRIDTVSDLTAVISALNNIGPGLGVVGPTGNFGSYSIIAKLIFIVDMLFGRLEIIPLLVLFAPPKFAKRTDQKEFDLEED